MKTIIIITSLLIASILSAQQIGDGRAIEITDFSAPLKSGVYQGSLPIGMNPDTQVYGWQHLFVIRHSNDANNHQLQLSSSYTMNDRLFFRKIAGGFEPNNPVWVELATRGSNSFIGDQYISGNLGIGTPTPSFYQHGGNNKVLEIYNPNTTIHSQSHLVISSGSVSANSSIGSITWAVPNASNKSVAYLGVITTENSTTTNPGADMVFATKSVSNSNWVEQMRVNSIGNVGIGTTNPTSKLTVAGNINSREVKVTVDAGADFVFENNYNLPSLNYVDKYIQENKHLPEIASAEEMKKDGINLSEMNIKLLQKIEELTLYSIEQNNKIGKLEEQNKKLMDLEKRLEKIESNSK
ncbi:hypothetical protein D3C85_719820 [compost metagenome]